MDIYQLRAEGYVSYSMTDEVLRTRKQAMGTYFNKAGQEVACVSTPTFDESGRLCMVVTYSRRLDILETFQKALQQEKEKLKGYRGYGHASTTMAESKLWRMPRQRGGFLPCSKHWLGWTVPSCSMGSPAWAKRWRRILSAVTASGRMRCLSRSTARPFRTS